MDRYAAGTAVVDTDDYVVYMLGVLLRWILMDILCVLLLWILVNVLWVLLLCIPVGYVVGTAVVDTDRLLSALLLWLVMDILWVYCCCGFL